jgi:hypothetical protein
MTDLMKRWQELRDKPSFTKSHTEDGIEYQSITSFLSTYPSYVDPLIKWAIEKFTNIEEYEEFMKKAAEEGTAMHEQCERMLKGEDEDFPGMQSFMQKYNPEVISMEETIFDKELGLAGKYDALLKICDLSVLIDWKSSKSVQEKHKAQVAFYAHNKGAQEAWVVCFGTENKQGYSISKVDIAKYYKRVALLKEFYNV